MLLLDACLPTFDLRAYGLIFEIDTFTRQVLCLIGWSTLHLFLGCENKITSMNSYKRSHSARRPQRQPALTLVQNKRKSKQPLSQQTIDYKNASLLRQFITVEGKILPRRVKKLTAKQQRHVAKAIKNARMAGFLPFVNKTGSPLGPNRRPTSRRRKFVPNRRAKPLDQRNQKKFLPANNKK